MGKTNNEQIKCKLGSNQLENMARAVAVWKGEYGLNHHVGREASKRFYVVDI